MKLSSRVSNTYNQDDEYKFPGIYIGIHNDDIVLIDFIYLSNDNSRQYRGAMLHNSYDNYKINLQWWIKNEENALNWIKSNYKPFYGEVTIKSSRD